MNARIRSCFQSTVPTVRDSLLTGITTEYSEFGVITVLAVVAAISGPLFTLGPTF